jgi:hypothetical protein
MQIFSPLLYHTQSSLNRFAEKSVRKHSKLPFRQIEIKRDTPWKEDCSKLACFVPTTSFLVSTPLPPRASFSVK